MRFELPADPHMRVALMAVWTARPWIFERGEPFNRGYLRCLLDKIPVDTSSYSVYQKLKLGKKTD